MDNVEFDGFRRGPNRTHTLICCCLDGPDVLWLTATTSSLERVKPTSALQRRTHKPQIFIVASSLRFGRKKFSTFSTLAPSSTEDTGVAFRGLVLFLEAYRANSFGRDFDSEFPSRPGDRKHFDSATISE